jgi:hypothetical protein
LGNRRRGICGGLRRPEYGPERPDGGAELLRPH